MTAALDLTEEMILTDLRSVLLGLLPDGWEVIRTQDNQVPQPVGPDFLTMTPIRRERIATNVDTWDYLGDAPTVLDIEQSTKLTIQLDVYGPQADDVVQIVSTVFRSGSGCAMFEALGHGIDPLYSGDPLQKPFINGEAQYENRWSVDIALQANPIVTVPQDFADALSPSVHAPIA